MMLIFLSACGDSPAISSNDTATEEVAENVEVANKAVFCQCVDYIRNRFNLNGYYGNAKDWHNNLIKAGYKTTANPKAGDIVIFQPSFGGVNTTYGHIAAVVSYSYTYNTQTRVGTRKLTDRSANTGGTSTESNCNNVGNSNRTYTDTKVGSIRYYTK